MPRTQGSGRTKTGNKAPIPQILLKNAIMEPYVNGL